MCKFNVKNYHSQGNPLTLFVGMQADGTTPESSMEFPQKGENRATL